MTDIARYQSAWERYWKETFDLNKESSEKARSIWDYDPANAAELDLPRFRELMSADVPLIDFGCGSGTQTKFLSKYFKKVVGTDVSESALALAKLQNSAPNVTYALLDAFDLDAVSRLHDQLGDANIYMRAVLHQIALEDRTRFIRGVKSLLGKKGTLYVYELGSNTNEYAESFIKNYGVPDKLERVFRTGMGPGPVSRADLSELVGPEYTVVADGDCFAKGGFLFPAGSTGKQVAWEPPIYYAAVRAASS